MLFSRLPAALFIYLLCAAVRGGSSNRTYHWYCAPDEFGSPASGACRRWKRRAAAAVGENFTHELLTTTLTLFRQLNGIRFLGDLSTDGPAHINGKARFVMTRWSCVNADYHAGSIPSDICSMSGGTWFKCGKWMTANPWQRWKRSMSSA